MNTYNYKKIEEVIGYEFNNKMLLEQAFIRSSFANEHNCESNEVLEFVGDKVLDLAVIMIMLEEFGRKPRPDEYLNTYKKEGELTKIKIELVSTPYLSTCFDLLKLNQFIKYGENDINNHAEKNPYIKEDTLESIIGAIAIDSNWNMKKIVNIVKNLLHTNEFFKKKVTSTNYVGMLQESAAADGLSMPIYKFKQIDQSGELLWEAILTINELGERTRGTGHSQKEAKQQAAKKMIPIIMNYEVYIASEMRNKGEEDVFSIINYYVQTGEISKPEYEFEDGYDDDGNPIWECKAIVHSLGYIYYGHGSTKKESQRNALKHAINDIENDIEEED